MKNSNNVDMISDFIETIYGIGNALFHSFLRLRIGFSLTYFQA